MLFFVNIILGISFLNAQELFTESYTLMGSAFELTVVAHDKAEAQAHIATAKNEIERIELLISSWDSNSETSSINQNAGIKPVKVSKELWDLIDRSQRISKITSGAFDLTFAAVDQIWKLNKEQSTVFLPQKGMKIGFGAIGKGYAADRAKQLLESRGVVGGIINASGDMNTWGTQPDGSPWTIGIVNPMNKEKVFSWFSLEHKAVVTSGNYEKFIRIDGKRYSHIIDPRTGIPSNGIISCTIFASKAELADALATATFVMGVESGLFLIDQLPNTEAILIDDKGIIHRSKNIQIEKN